jgi:hypothetical protein
MRSVDLHGIAAVEQVRGFYLIFAMVLFIVWLIDAIRQRVSRSPSGAVVSLLGLLGGLMIFSEGVLAVWLRSLGGHELSMMKMLSAPGWINAYFLMALGIGVMVISVMPQKVAAQMERVVRSPASVYMLLVLITAGVGIWFLLCGKTLGLWLILAALGAGLLHRVIPQILR